VTFGGTGKASLYWSTPHVGVPGEGLTGTFAGPRSSTPPIPGWEARLQPGARGAHAHRAAVGVDSTAAVGHQFAGLLHRRRGVPSTALQGALAHRRDLRDERPVMVPETTTALLVRLWAHLGRLRAVGRAAAKTLELLAADVIRRR